MSKTNECQISDIGLCDRIAGEGGCIAHNQLISQGLHGLTLDDENLTLHGDNIQSMIDETHRMTRPCVRSGKVDEAMFTVIQHYANRKIILFNPNFEPTFDDNLNLTPEV